MTEVENEKQNTIVVVKSQIDRLERALLQQQDLGETGIADQTVSVDPEVDRVIEKLRENIRSVQRAIVDGVEAATCSVDALKAAVQEGSRRQDERLQDKTVLERNALLADELDRLKGAAEKASHDREELAQQLAVLKVERFVLDDLMKSVENVS